MKDLKLTSSISANSNNIATTTISEMGKSLLNKTSGTTCIWMWQYPTFIEAREVGETIEFIYKETSMFQISIYPPRPPAQRVFKIVYSCKDGKWNKSEPIYGTIIPEQSESYNFDE